MSERGPALRRRALALATGATLVMLSPEVAHSVSSVTTTQEPRSGWSAWSSPQLLSNARGVEDEPQLALSSDGRRQFALWREQSEQGTSLRAAISTSGGQEWTSSAAPEIAWPDTPLVQSSDALRLLLVNSTGDELQTYASPDGGGTWRQLPGPSLREGTYPYNLKLAVSDSAQDVALAWGEGPNAAVASSSDFAETWSTTQSIASAGRDVEIADLEISGDGAVRSTVVLVTSRPSVDSVVAVTTSADGGKTWSGLRSLSEEGQTSTEAVLLISRDGRMQLAMWSQSNSTSGVRQLFAARTEDAGATWSQPYQVPRGGGRPISQAMSPNGNRVAVLTSQGGVIQSFDGGKTWEPPTFPGGQFVTASDVSIDISEDATHQAVAWAYQGSTSARPEVMTSSDGGSTWSRQAMEGAWAQAPSIAHAMSQDGMRQAAVYPVRTGGQVVMAYSGSTFEPSGSPSAPTGVMAALAGEFVEVTWGKPASDGGSRVLTYKATASPGGAACSTSFSLSCRVSGLTPGATYTFTVTASNTAGASPPSLPSPEILYAVTPTAVRSLRVSPFARGSITVTWSVPSYLGGAPAVTYQVRINGGVWRSTSATRLVARGLGANSRVRVEVVPKTTAGLGPVATALGRAGQ